MSLRDVKQGDTLVLTETSNKGETEKEVTVARVGSKYLYVLDSHGHEVLGRYSRDTGHDVDRYSRSSRLYTREGLAKARERSELLNTLRVLGLDIRHDTRADMSTAMLRALHAALTADYAAPQESAADLTGRAVAAALTRDRATLARDAQQVSEAAARVAKDPEQAHRLGYVVRLAEDAQALALLATRIRAVAETAELYAVE